MPELPDVEIFKQYLDATALHQRIAAVAECSDDLLREVTRRSLEESLVGRTLSAARRHGKYLFVRLDSERELVLHFGMTGFLRYYKRAQKEPGHVRLRLELENGYHLAYDCQRKLGQITLADSSDDFIAEHELGPDALELCRRPDAFAERLSGHRGTIKGLLMNQKVLAGLGNVYSDEILFQADIAPRTPARQLEEDDRRNLARRTRHVLETAIEKRVGEKGWPRSWLLPRREEGKSCPRCEGSIERISVSGRSGYYCPGHQQG